MQSDRSVRSLPASVLACLAVTVLVGLGLAAPSYASNGHAVKAADHTTSGTAGTSGDVSSPQPTSTADQNTGGANGKCPGGPYCSTRDGSPSGNGNGNGKATGKPCAGCVGKADNKNPQGQNPNGSDHNAGYECDRNHGIGRSNPAHTGCSGTTTPPPACVDNPNTPMDECGTTTPPGQCTDNPATPADECGTTTPPGQCTDNPATPMDECGTTTPPGQCTDNPATPMDECGTVSPPVQCTDNPATPMDECGTVSPPVQCTDNPATPRDECGSTLPPTECTASPAMPSVQCGTVSPPVATSATSPHSGTSAAAPTGRTVAPRGVLPNTGAPVVLPAVLAGLALLGTGLVLLRRRTA